MSRARWALVLAAGCAGGPEPAPADRPVEQAPLEAVSPLAPAPASAELSVTLGESVQPFSSVDVVCERGDRWHVRIEGGRVVFRDLPPESCWLRFKGGGTPVMAPLPTLDGAVHCEFPSGEALCSVVDSPAPSSGSAAPMEVRLSGPGPEFNSAQVECEGGFLQERPWTGAPVAFEGVPDLDCRLVFHGKGPPAIVQHVRGGTRLVCSFDGRTPSCVEQGGAPPG